MEQKWLLCAALLLLGTVIQAHEDHDHDHGDDDVIDIEDDLDDGVEEVEKHHETSTPPLPKVLGLIVCLWHVLSRNRRFISSFTEDCIGSGTFQLLTCFNFNMLYFHNL